MKLRKIYREKAFDLFFVVSKNRMRTEVVVARRNRFGLYIKSEKHLTVR